MPLLPISGSRALQSIYCKVPYIDVASKHPVPEDASILWNIYCQRVHPLGKVLFDSEIDQMRAAAISPNGPSQFTVQEHAFIFAVYLLSVRSLSEDECLRLLSRPKSALFSDYQIFCEQALSGSSFFCVADFTTIQALTLYVVSRETNY